MKTIRYPLKLTVPDTVMRVFGMLQKAGGEVYLTGGVVRDALLGRETLDIDLATSLPYEKLTNIIPKDWVTVYLPQYQCVKNRLDGFFIDVTAFRKEGTYVDHRHPSSVSPASRREDAKRRDLTMNALYYDPIKQEVIDDFGGVNDLLHLGVVRLIQGQKSLEEDYLRILRVIRFSLQCGLDIEADTLKAVQQTIHLALSVDTDRFRQEIVKCLQKASIYEVLLAMESAGFLTLFQASLSHQLHFSEWLLDVLSAFVPGEAKIQDLIFIFGLLSYQVREPQEILDGPIRRFLCISKKQVRQIKKSYLKLAKPHLEISNYRPTPVMNAIVKAFHQSDLRLPGSLNS